MSDTISSTPDTTFMIPLDSQSAQSIVGMFTQSRPSFLKFITPDDIRNALAVLEIMVVPLPVLTNTGLEPHDSPPSGHSLDLDSFEHITVGLVPNEPGGSSSTHVDLSLSPFNTNLNIVLSSSPIGGNLSEDHNTISPTLADCDTHFGDGDSENPVDFSSPKHLLVYRNEEETDNIFPISAIRMANVSIQNPKKVGKGNMKRTKDLIWDQSFINPRVVPLTSKGIPLPTIPRSSQSTRALRESIAPNR